MCCSLPPQVEKLIETALGLAYLHGFQQPIIHGDIKVRGVCCSSGVWDQWYVCCLMAVQPSNLLLDSFKRVKISDFGMAKVEWKYAENKAPQVRSQQPANKPSSQSEH